MAAAFSSVPPFFRYAVMPVARKLWLPNSCPDAGRRSAPADHGVGVLLEQRIASELGGAMAHGAEERTLRIAGQNGAGG